jgi:LPS-assembly protein
MAGSPTDPPRACRAAVRRVAFIAGLVVALGAVSLPAPVLAQQSSVSGQGVGAPTGQTQILTFPQAPKPTKRAKLPQKRGQEQMLVQARRIDYDYTNHRVSAVGNVQIYYNGSTLEADKVTYDENTKRLHAEGNARLADQDGNVTYGEVMDLSDDYRDGFVDSLHIERFDRTSIAAARANRTGGNFTVFDSGVYTACLPCRDNPKKPPLWQVKAARIIHDQGEKMIYFEDAKIEFFGQPLLYLPYLSAPDPTVKRKTGFLIPSFTTNTLYGAAIELPYYWALAPNYDVTLSPMITTKQGPLLQGEFRQRTMDGAYAIRAAGIYQLDKDVFADGAPGDRNFRGSIESTGQFALNDKWVWGWDAIAMSDRSFLQDYRPRLSNYTNNLDPGKLGLPGNSEAVSQIYLTGKGNRSYFDIRSIYYTGFSNQDEQRQLPIIHPVIDHLYTFDRPILGGELTFRSNLTSLSRDTADFDKIRTGPGICGASADPATVPQCFVLRGMPGDYTRASTEATWKRTLTDPLGQQWTPFFSVRADVAAISVSNQPGVANYLPVGQDNLARAMPAAGLEYRYPFINVQSWGTQTLTPIAQVIARPDEPQIGRWPNETSQSFTFDDSNLFSVNKFSGWDRVEGGGRANVGVQYTAQFNQGGMVDALFGQSYRLFGTNSFAQPGASNTGLDSGLDKNVSDYVARLSFQPNKTYKFTSRFRFDDETMKTERLELEASATYDRWGLAVTYGRYAAQPELGFFTAREGILGSASYKLDANWVLYGSALYDLDQNKLAQGGIGVGYVDDCFIVALNYLSAYSYDVTGLTNPKRVDTVMLQIGLRTLGETSFNQRLTSAPTTVHQ